jgi:hypothetical protein
MKTWGAVHERMAWPQAEKSHPKDVSSAIAVQARVIKSPRDPTDAIPGDQHPILRFYGHH